MPLYGYYNYNVTVSDGKVLFEPCQQFQHQNSINNETFEFQKIEGSDQFGWNGSIQIPLTVDSQNNMLKFQNPYDMSKLMPMMLIHPKNVVPAEGILTYYDETDGGYSAARIRITDESQIKSGKCFIHSKKTNEYNGDIVGNYSDDYDSSMNLTLNGDFSGVYKGLPVKWSIVSDHSGKVKKWDYPDGGYMIHIVLEFENGIPANIDPPSAGHSVGIIDGVRISKADGTVTVGRMNKR